MNFTDEELFKMDMLKDKRRRLLYVIKGKQEGYHILEREMKIMNIITGRNLWVLLGFVLSYGLLRQSLLVSVIVSVVVFIGFYLYEKYIFLKDRNIIKISDEDYAKLNSLSALKSKKTDTGSYVIVPLLVIIILVTRNADGRFNPSEFDLWIMYIGIVLLVLMSGYFSLQYLKLRKDIKSLEDK
ncbi:MULTISPECIES: hypothetical protein [Erysipelothrix]|uniref:DUF3278 domain-containing protein n=1 Tax=Erysipelothrix piscisicarius TaxID=2485784 RepID=A0A3S8RMN4_9FIRM|nr:MULTISPECIES: hypothetical protein [Erysipelothrix]AZK44186.1 hypothetical protein EEI45_04990 [Erysipelothrix piscisicarius]MBK2402288.1 hypothetical protein [Erysipelothrix sp. strain 2 (EsS2-6-Brazil)]MBK2404471.1 hypothetical protein [Erysipelothrix sp. strain 2 (EsS2-7-Brazil)]NBA01962.1 hypothetical protein [Erysipelothrix rhusiopathiae]